MALKGDLGKDLGGFFALFFFSFDFLYSNLWLSVGQL